VSGLPSSRVLFLGFPPRKKGERVGLLGSLAAEPSTLVFYEAPHRIRRFLKESLPLLAGRECVAAREVTKRFEEVLPVGDAEAVPERGEFVVLFGPPSREPGASLARGDLGGRVRELVSSGIPEKEALKKAAREGGISKREIYGLLKVKGRGDRG
jgi:16S rRNA (cytidine1402-2'-O)-methyltransferase